MYVNIYSTAFSLYFRIDPHSRISIFLYFIFASLSRQRNIIHLRTIVFIFESAVVSATCKLFIVDKVKFKRPWNNYNLRIVFVLLNRSCLFIVKVYFTKCYKNARNPWTGSGNSFLAGKILIQNVYLFF